MKQLLILISVVVVFFLCIGSCNNKVREKFETKEAKQERLIKTEPYKEVVVYTDELVDKWDLINLDSNEKVTTTYIRYRFYSNTELYYCFLYKTNKGSLYREFLASNTYIEETNELPMLQKYCKTKILKKTGYQYEYGLITREFKHYDSSEILSLEYYYKLCVPSNTIDKTFKIDLTK